MRLAISGWRSSCWSDGTFKHLSREGATQLAREDLESMRVVGGFPDASDRSDDDEVFLGVIVSAIEDLDRGDVSSTMKIISSWIDDRCSDLSSISRRGVIAALLQPLSGPLVTMPDVVAVSKEDAARGLKLEIKRLRQIERRMPYGFLRGVRRGVRWLLAKR